MSESTPVSIPHVADVQWVRGSRAPAGSPADLLLEVPHGATTEAHYDALRAELRGDLPPNLKDFFFVNTDVGAPEVARRVAELVVAAQPGRTALVIRCRIPRTFVDCNRLINAEHVPSTSEPGAITPGIVSYVRDAGDIRLLLRRYGEYRALVERAYGQVCGLPATAPGQAVMLHTYAPRSVDVVVDERIVERLRAAYQPDQVGRWPLRPSVDLITRDGSGCLLASESLVAATRAAYLAAGLDVAENQAYHLHESTLAYALALRHRGQTLCLELRRDLLARAFTPFSEMQIDPARVERMAAPLAMALSS